MIFFCNKDSGLCRLVQCNTGHVTFFWKEGGGDGGGGGGGGNPK